MKKLFLTICFSLVFITLHSSYARIVELNDVNNAPKSQVPFSATIPDGLPDPNNLEEVVRFFRERFKNASVSRAEDFGDMNQANAVNVQHSAEYIQQMQENNKSTFEKIYDQAMERISDTSQDNGLVTGTRFFELAPVQSQSAATELQQPNVPVVNAMLPTGRNVLVPAREHIPYMLSSFNILPTGLIQITEDITVVANGQKLKHGVTKILPKYSKSRSGVRKKLDIQLLSVTINNQKIPYVLEEIGDYIIIKPQQKYVLQPGVYNYSFKYLLDRKLWYYDDFTEFYWDVTGSYLNLVITSANAIVSIPDGKNFLTQTVLTGYANRLTHNRAMIAALDDNALGFASTTPVLPGEGMHILVSLDKNVFLEPGIDRYIVWFITDYGDILFALAGFAAVLISYMLSWRYIKRQKKQSNGSFKLTAPTLRYLFKNRFDKTAFSAWLLELYRKNIIDIQQQEQTILLIKKTDDFSSLSRSEKKAMNNLFVGKDSVIAATSANALKFKRAAAAMEKGNKMLVKLLSLQLNIGYLLFSIGMLLLTELAIALLGINPLQTGLVLFSGTLTIAFYMWIMKRRFKSKIVNYAVMILGGLFILFAILLMGVYIKFISALILAMTVFIIFEYSELFGKRGGFIKTKTKNCEELRAYLEGHAHDIAHSHEFAVQQANIFALDLCALYPVNNDIVRNYKLDLAAEITQLL